MSEFTELLDVNAKKDIINQRILKLAQDGYQLELNYSFAVSQGKEDAAQGFKEAIEAMKASIEFHKKELASLDA